VPAGVKNARTWIAVLSAVAIAAAALVFVRITTNPPGFYIDESSVAYNAHTIAMTGRDENGVRWPLYFRAFGDYKNPVYVYLVAAVFRITGPSILAPRLVSALFITGAAALLGLLALRLTRSRQVALLIMICALVTPWLFELGRVALEVALYPFILALFFHWLHRASEKEKWRAGEVASLAVTLALLTYSYSIGRLLAPLFALGLAFFWTGKRWRGVVATWLAYAVLLIPLAIFSSAHPAALTERFRIITYLRPNIALTEAASQFIRHYFANLNPWRLLVTGDPNPDQIVHVHGTYLFLGATFVCSLIGLGLAFRDATRDPWWRYLLYASAVSIVPASLTNEHFHMLRLVPVPVLLLTFAIPAFGWMNAQAASAFWRKTFVVLLALAAAQAALFQWKYHRTADSARRVHLFDAEYPTKIFDPAIASAAHPIYLADALWIPGYIQAYWYATLRGIDLSRFHRLPPDEAAPLGATIISTEENCPGCEIMTAVRPYTLALAKETPRPRTPLPREAFRAELSVADVPSKFSPKRPATVRVRVKNASAVVWLARERGGGAYQVSLGNHWLDRAGKPLINDDGRSAILRDLKPGETTELSLTVNPPAEPGPYILEIDMLQEGVSWFGLTGSTTVRLPVEVR
jgi:4-amino-4-deoxy-L-arabinose transferase-like glycosyltransferase